MKTKTGLALLATGIALALGNVTAPALTIGFSPVHQTVPLGSSPQVAIVATLDTTPSLSAWDLMMNWNPAIVSFASVTFGSALGSSWQIMDKTGILSGQLRLTEVSLEDALFFDNQPSPITLATITFSAVHVGTSPLDLRLDVGALSTGEDPPGSIIPTLQSGSITVTDRQVPEGGNLAIIALPTLIGLLLLAKRAQHAKP